MKKFLIISFVLIAAAAARAESAYTRITFAATPSPVKASDGTMFYPPSAEVPVPALLLSPNGLVLVKKINFDNFQNSYRAAKDAELGGKTAYVTDYALETPAYYPMTNVRPFNIGEGFYILKINFSAADALKAKNINFPQIFTDAAAARQFEQTFGYVPGSKLKTAMEKYSIDAVKYLTPQTPPAQNSSALQHRAGK